MTQRTDRVDELLRQEIGQLLARDVADPRIGFATITDVETTPDLRHAKVWVSVIGTEAERKAAVGALAHAMPFIRHELGGRLRIKRIPELHVRLDDTSERGTRVLRLLDELESGVTADVSGLDAEALGGREAQDADLALVQVVVHLVRGFACVVERPHRRPRRSAIHAH